VTHPEHVGKRSSARTKPRALSEVNNLVNLGEFPLAEMTSALSCHRPNDAAPSVSLDATRTTRASSGCLAIRVLKIRFPQISPTHLRRKFAETATRNSEIKQITLIYIGAGKEILAGKLCELRFSFNNLLLFFIQKIKIIKGYYVCKQGELNIGLACSV